MGDFDFKKVLKENIIEREDKKINEEQDINEFVKGFFRPRFGTNLAAINNPPKEDEEGEKESKIEPGQWYVVVIVDPTAEEKEKEKIGYGYAKVAKNYTNTSDDMVPIEKIQLPPDSEELNKKVKDILKITGIQKLKQLPKDQFIRKADKEDQRLDKTNLNENTLLVTEGLLDRLKSFFATNKKPDNERIAKINKLVQVIQSGEYRTNLPSDDVEDIVKRARETLAKYDQDSNENTE